MTRNRDAILNLIKPGDTVLEIGTWKGEFATEILQRDPGQLVLCDPWKFRPDLPNTWHGGAPGGASSQTEMDEIYVRVCAALFHLPNVRILRCSSYFLPSIYFNTPRMFDLIYIDGDHSFGAVLCDFFTADVLVKRGGFICGDDYRDGCGVKKAVEEYAYKNSGRSVQIHGDQYVIPVL